MLALLRSNGFNGTVPEHKATKDSDHNILMIVCTCLLSSWDYIGTFKLSN